MAKGKGLGGRVTTDKSVRSTGGIKDGTKPASSTHGASMISSGTAGGQKGKGKSGTPATSSTHSAAMISYGGAKKK
jgi:hypothetical protein